MRIEYKELRDLFKIESEEQLARLDDGLLQLEKDPENQILLEEMFRHIHTLKGGVRMLFLPDMEAIAHRIEDVLAAAKKKELLLNADIIDRLSRALDALKRLADVAVTGHPAEIEVSAILAQFPTPAEMTGQALHLELAAQTAVETDHPAPNQPGPAHIPTSHQPETRQEGPDVVRFRIDTIRVATEKLDSLMPLVGELGVTKNRLAHRLVTIDETLRLWDKLTRIEAGFRSSLNEMQRDSGNGSVKRIAEHQAQKQELVENLGTLLNAVRTAAYEDSSNLEFIAGDLEDGVRSIRLLPLSTVFNLFPRMVRDLARAQGKEAQLSIEGGETTADKRILEEIKDPLMHMIRNAIDHGIEPPEERERLGKSSTGVISLKAYQTASNVIIELSDDGRGMDLEAIKSNALRAKLCTAEELEAMTPADILALILMSGFSTSTFVSDVSGRGVGLDVVRANVEGLKGSIRIESTVGAGSAFTVQLPITLATVRVLIVEVEGRKYAVPVEHVQSTRLVPRHEIFTLEGHGTTVLDDRPVSLLRLADLLELEENVPRQETGPEDKTTVVPCVFISSGEDRAGLLVDELIDEQEIVLKPQSTLLRRVKNTSGATILGTGEVCMVLNAQDLLKSVRKRETHSRARLPIEEIERTKVILMAEDSLTTRTQMKRILEGAGYEVVTAVDGLDAFDKIGARPFDALVTDIMMPNMDGLTLTQKLRADAKYRELPIILVTTLSSDEDRKKGLDVGASAYITKPAFDQKVFLDTLRRLT